MLATLCHDFGTPATTEFLEGPCVRADTRSGSRANADSFLDRLNIQTMDCFDVRAQVVALVRDHLSRRVFQEKMK